MTLLLMILGAAVASVLVAILIVKFLPLNLRWIASVLLLILAIFLGYKIYQGIMEPIQFAKEKVERYKPVIQKLKIIRDAQMKHYEVTGNYTKDKQGLIQFVDTAQLAITETKTIVEKVNRGGGIIIDVEKRVTDTIGYEPVAKYFENRDYKNMWQVPGVAGKEFEVEIGTVEKVAGLVVPTFYVKTTKEDILQGLSKSLVKQEKEAIEADQIKGEFVSVGSLDEVSTGGNWPPSYDKKDGAKKE
ncbi:MAG: hypothetical protein ACON4X_07690 [Polaribacter sp.]|jgi:hypothetical protein